MKYVLSFLLVVILNSSSISQTWVKNNSFQFISKIQILTHDNSFNTSNSIYPSTGYVVIFFSDGSQRTASIYPINAILTPSFLVSTNDYEYYAVYDVRSSANMLSSDTADGIAFRVFGSELCVGYFRYTLKSRSASIFGLGCLKPGKNLPLTKAKNEIDYLQKLTKAQLIEIIKGKKPTFPITPVCLSCPHSKEYEKLREALIHSFDSKTFKVELEDLK